MYSDPFKIKGRPDLVTMRDLPIVKVFQKW
jgi:hypothetical protein